MNVTRVARLTDLPFVEPLRASRQAKNEKGVEIKQKMMMVTMKIMTLTGMLMTMSLLTLAR